MPHLAHPRHEVAVLEQLRAALFHHGEAQTEALAAGLELLRTADLRASLASIAVPALALAGQYDRVLLPAAALGGLVFEVLKQLVTQYAVLAVPDNTYAAFAVPLALLAWIYLVARLLMFLAASTAEWAAEHSAQPVP